MARRPPATERLQAWLARQWWSMPATPAAQALRPFSWLYGALVALRKALFRVGWLNGERAPVKLLVVGNLIAGGAGKTPTVMALVQGLREAGWTPGVISRGHGGQADAPRPVQADSSAAAVGDEPLLIRLRTGAPVWVGRRRAAVARALCAAEPAVNVIVADDGLQHLALARDVQVIVFDERGAGNGLLQPAGPLREPLPAVLPPATQVLYNAPAPSTPLPGSLARRRLAGAVLLADWWQGRPATLAALHALRGREVLAAAGLAMPERFFSMLEAEGLRIRRLPLPDHHDYAEAPWPADARDVLLTEKDAVKLRPTADGPRLWVVALDFVLPSDFLQAVLAPLGTPPPP